MLETETVLDRRSLRRSLTMWRGLGIFAIAAALGALMFGGDGLSGMSGEKQIARVAIEGTISESRDQLQMLKKIEEAENVEGLLLYINSPGGTTTGGEAIYDALRRISHKKPVVAQFGTMAASAGYIVGLAADHIISRGNTITGSIGVIVQWPEVEQFLDKVGVKVNEVKSGPLKARPSPFEKLTPGGLKVTQGMVDDSFKWFVSLVEARRNIQTGAVPGLMDGRIFTGREALAANLVDQLGGEEEAVEWLQTEKQIDKEVKVVDWKPESTSSYGFFGATAQQFVGWAFGADAAHGLSQLLSARRFSTLGLDGLLSVWHPSEK